MTGVGCPTVAAFRGIGGAATTRGEHRGSRAINCSTKLWSAFDSDHALNTLRKGVCVPSNSLSLPFAGTAALLGMDFSDLCGGLRVLPFNHCWCNGCTKASKPFGVGSIPTQWAKFSSHLFGRVNQTGVLAPVASGLAVYSVGFDYSALRFIGVTLCPQFGHSVTNQYIHCPQNGQRNPGSGIDGLGGRRITYYSFRRFPLCVERVRPSWRARW